MFKRLKNINPRVLLSHMIVTLAYPACKALIAESNKLMVFIDVMTIIALVMLIGGIIYAMILHGDFDISGFLLRRGARGGEKKGFREYLADLRENREKSFNYPLFLSLVYLAAAAFIAYVIL
ncbi:MAG: hypothetical protein IKQ69_09510 [Oscillospiraceae bacterium]|nr:hypothetical protein [Oscillospiraceae bacterium]